MRTLHCLSKEGDNVPYLHVRTLPTLRVDYSWSWERSGALINFDLKIVVIDFLSSLRSPIRTFTTMFGRYAVYALTAYSLTAGAGARAIAKLDPVEDKTPEGEFWQNFVNVELDMSVPANPPTLPPGR